MKKYSVVLVCCFLFFATACGQHVESHGEAQMLREKAYKTVQHHPSSASGLPIVEYVQFLLNLARGTGSLVEVIGWYSVKRYVPGKKESGYEVYFELLENGKKMELKWIVDETWQVYPVSELARAATASR